MRTGLLALALLAIVITGVRCEESRAQMVPDAPKNPDAEKLAKAIVVAISTDNYAAFTDLLVTQRDFVNVMRSSTNPQVQERANDSITGIRSVHKKARRSFDDIRKDGTRDGIAWERAKYKSSTFAMDTTDGVEIIYMTIVIDFRGAEYPIIAKEIVKTKTGWKILGRLEYGGPTKYAYELAMVMRDSIAMADSMMVAQMTQQYESMRIADSVAAVRMQWATDSTRIADSLAASSAKKKGKKKK